MHSRTIAVYHAMCRVADLIDAHPDLRARAAESTAFAHFLDVIARFEAMRTEEVTADVEIRALRAQRSALLDSVMLELRRIEATAAIARDREPSLEALEIPDRKLFMIMFVTSARTCVTLARKYSALLVETGLHPQAFDDALTLINQLEDVDRRCSHAEVFFRSHAGRLELVVDEARKRLRQLSFELRPALSLSVREEWRAAAALGRVHRRKALSAGEAMKRLPATTEAHE